MKNIALLSVVLFAWPAFARGDSRELLGLHLKDNFKTLEKGLVAKYGAPVQSQSPQDDIQQVAFNFKTQKLFLVITYRISDGQILCLGADGGTAIGANGAGPLPGHLDLNQKETEIKKRLGKPSDVTQTSEGFTHYDYKTDDVSFEVKAGRIYSFLMCSKDQEPEPASYKYSVFQNGKLVGEEKTVAPKYAETISTPKVLYVKSLGMIIESDGSSGKSPLESTIEGCTAGSKEKKEATGIMCRLVAYYYLETKNLKEALLYLGKACELHDPGSCETKTKLEQASKSSE